MQLRSVSEYEGVPSVFKLVSSVTIIGRNPFSDICLTSMKVSRFHAKIILRIDGTYFLQVTTSKKSVFVNRQPISEKNLEPGDEIVIDKYCFIFENSPENISSTNNTLPNPVTIERKEESSLNGTLDGSTEVIINKSSLLGKRRREDTNSKQPQKLQKTNSGTPKPRRLTRLSSEPTLSTTMRPEDINQLVMVLNTHVNEQFDNVNCVRMVLDITEFFTRLGVTTISDLFSNKSIKDGLSLAVETKNISGLIYFSSILYSKLLDINRKVFYRTINYDLIESFFKTEKSYTPLQKIAFAFSKQEIPKQKLLEFLRTYFLVESNNIGASAHIGQADFTTNCLLLCISKGVDNAIPGTLEYFLDEIIFKRIIDFATQDSTFEIGSADKQIQLQMLDACRYILQILYHHSTLPLTLQIATIIREYIPKLTKLIRQSEKSPGSLTISLKSIQLFEELINLYSILENIENDFSSEILFINQLYQIIKHPRQYVMLPQCSSILKKIFRYGTPKALVRSSFNSLLSFEKEFRELDSSLKYFTTELWNLLNSFDLLTPQDKQKLTFLIDTPKNNTNENLTETKLEKSKNEIPSTPTQTCILL